MLKKILPTLLLILACPSVADAEGACRAACSWSNWGQRTEVCASPSEGILTDMLDCWRRPDGDPAGGCGTSCAGWLADYDACASSVTPTCTMGPSSPACDSCVYSSCGAPSNACSTDTTECVPCADWIGGGWDPSYLCYYSIQPAVDLSGCACSPTCSAKCGSACGSGHLDPDLATFGCGTCIASKCSAQYSACSSN